MDKTKKEGHKGNHSVVAHEHTMGMRHIMNRCNDNAQGNQNLDPGGRNIHHIIGGKNQRCTVPDGKVSNEPKDLFPLVGAIGQTQGRQEQKMVIACPVPHMRKTQLDQ